MDQKKSQLFFSSKKIILKIRTKIFWWLFFSPKILIFRWKFWIFTKNLRFFSAKIFDFFAKKNIFSKFPNYFFSMKKMFGRIFGDHYIDVEFSEESICCIFRAPRELCVLIFQQWSVLTSTITCSVGSCNLTTIEYCPMYSDYLQNWRYFFFLSIRLGNTCQITPRMRKMDSSWKNKSI